MEIKFGQKLFRIMLIPVFLVITVGTVGFFSIRRLGKSSEKILSENYHSIQESHNITRNVYLLLAPGKNPENLNKIEKSIKNCRRNITESGEIALISEMEKYFQELKNNPHGTSEFRTSALMLIRRVSDLIEINEKAMFRYRKKALKDANLFSAILIIFTLLSIAGIFIFTFIYSRRISISLREITGILRSGLQKESLSSFRGHEPGNEFRELKLVLLSIIQRMEEMTTSSDKLLILQKRLGFALDGIPEGVVIIDNDFTMLSVNRIAREILKGYSMENRILPAELRTLLAPRVKSEIRENLEFKCELNGENRLFSPRALEIPGTSGDIEGWLIIFWDISDESRYEESRRRFISMLSHQLKTPVTSISMSVNMLREKFASSEDKNLNELVNIAAENTSSLRTLISELIDASMDVPRDFSLRRIRIDAVLLLKNALKSLDVQAREKNVELIMPDGSYFVQIDPVKFPWVITNLVGNALRYTDAGGTITVKVSRDGDRINFRVSDTGRGMTPEMVPHVFTPNISTMDDSSGPAHGLGLAIAKEIVEAHGGTISVSSETGKGTEFVVTMETEDD